MYAVYVVSCSSFLLSTSFFCMVFTFGGKSVLGHQFGKMKNDFIEDKHSKIRGKNEKLNYIGSLSVPEMALAVFIFKHSVDMIDDYLKRHFNLIKC